MATFEVSLATADDAIGVGDSMRKQDQEEVWASGRWTPVGVCLNSYRISQMTYTWLVNGIPCALFGVAKLTNIENGGSPWMLGTQAVDDYPVQVLRVSKKWVAEMKSRFTYLENWVYSKNETSIRWLKDWCGFNIGEPMPYGTCGEKFCMFNWRKEDV